MAMAGTPVGRINFGDSRRPSQPVRAILPRVLAYFKPYWKSWILIFLSMGITAAGNLLPPLLAREIIDVALPGRWDRVPDVGSTSGGDPLRSPFSPSFDAIDGPVVVCGHSYGGFVITEAAANHPAVRRLVYLAAYMPDEGETLISLTASEPGAAILGALRPQDDGRTIVDPTQVGDIFFNDCEPAAAAWAMAHLSPMFTPGGDTATAIAWRDTPSVYIVASRDNAIPPALQRRMSAHASRVVEWDTGHSPFISQPQLVADLLASLATAS